MTDETRSSLGAIGLVWRTLVVGLVYVLVTMVTATIGVITEALSNASNGDSTSV